MSSFRFILNSLRYHWRIHATVALGVATATAVLTGALLVGDSVRGSLRDLTLQRLGRIDEVLIAPRMFRAALASEIQESAEGVEAVPAILISGTLFHGSGQQQTRANNVSVLGITDRFWTLEDSDVPTKLSNGEVGLTENIAQELGVKTGDEVLLVVSQVEDIPGDSPLGEKSETTESRRLKVKEILLPAGLARFSLSPSQHLPRNAFVSLTTLQELLQKPNMANAVLISGRGVLPNPTLADYGIDLEQRDGYVQISSEQLVLPDVVVEAVAEIVGEGNYQPVVTYLANTIRLGDRKIPYSTVTGVDSRATIGPLLDQEGQPIILAEDEIVLNQWATDDLEAAVGDSLSVTYYEPESTHGNLREVEPATFRLRAIAPLQGEEGKPARAADPKLTPQLPGVTDQESISDWDLPFELTETIRRKDEDYWDDYTTTPKAFVSFETAERLWKSRWGTVSLIRIPNDDVTSVEVLKNELEVKLEPEQMGFRLLPVKNQGLAASSGTTPFEGLFLGFSMFLVASSLMLIAMLFLLGVHQRVGEIGVLAATGCSRGQIARLLSREALIVAVVGGALGIVGGIAYAWLMVLGLTTLWVDAIATPFLELHLTARSLVVGWLLSTLVAWLTMRWSLRQVARLPIRQMLMGQSEARTSDNAASWRSFYVAMTLWLAAAGLALAGFVQRGEAQAGAFFGSGAAVLVALLIHAYRKMASENRQSETAAGHFTLAKLAALNAARHAWRSTLTLGLVAAACFLIVAISAFRLEPTTAGTGGFELMATSDRPVHVDLNDEEGLLELPLTDKQIAQLETWRYEALRIQDGDEASCLSLYRPNQPRVLGVPNWTLKTAAFAWADYAKDDQNVKDPWGTLQLDLGDDNSGREIVPVVLDMNTAMYSLQLYGGVGSQLTLRDSQDNPVTLQVVGLLKNSVLQGDLLISEENFLQLFPEVAGFRLFLARPKTDSQAAPTAEVGNLLESSLKYYGLDVVNTRQRLAAFLAVQNTYLSTFQSLGGLGLLLGTVGLALVQLRSVLQRRSELALMQASGFSRGRLVLLVLLENACLLLGGLLIGLVAAAVALIPHWALQNAAIPWLTLGGLIVVIAAAGTAAAWLATRRVLAAPLVPALRGE